MCSLTSRRAAAILVGTATLLLGARPLPAQRADAPPLTVAGAMALARANHPALAAASARRVAAVGAARQDAALPNPVVEWRQENVGSPLRPDRFLTVSQPLDLTGRRLALRAEVGLIDERAVADSATVARETEAAAARAYWRTSLALALLDVAATQRADAERLACVEGDRAREGAVAGLVAMRADVEAQRARLAEATARAEWERARATLASATGLAADALPPVPPMTLSARSPTPVPTVDATWGAALERRSDLLALRTGVEGAQQRRAAERRAVLPDVSLQLGTMQSAGYTARTVGVALPIPLLDRNAGGRARAAGALRIAEAELRAAENTAHAEAVAAVEALSALLTANGPGAHSLAARAAEVARVADAAYAEGGLTLLELLDARRAHAEALTAALRWSAELRLARLELNRVSGAPLSESLEMP